MGGKCRRQGGGGIRETVGEMMTKVCIYSGVKTRRWNTERRLREREREREEEEEEEGNK